MMHQCTYCFPAGESGCYPLSEPLCFSGAMSYEKRWGGAVGGCRGAGTYGTPPPLQDLLGGLLIAVDIQQPPRDEQLAILTHAFPSLTPLLPAAVGMLDVLQSAPVSRHANIPISHTQTA